ncbi:2313_t:CDS:2 [Dentiscutata erythropus]|uniref:2313_t:CDS:1 n=1 Tax=Dentiscutata erythropus TaxID=1348616 RepID=A0A9N9ATJ1_9GLOM|nr:2313_t:CDS:2 [Dentiscutata erythropus]
MISSFRRLPPRILTNIKIQKRLFWSFFIKEKKDKKSAEAHDLVTSVISKKLFVTDLTIKQIYDEHIQKLEAKNKEMMKIYADCIQKSEEHKEEIDDEHNFLARSEEVFQLRRVCNVRSALEYIRSWKGEDPLLYEPVDKVLEKLSNDQRFKECLINTCEMNNVNMEAVKKCIGGLYHTSSKGLHGYYKVVICEKDWVVNEIIALGLIFKYYGIPFDYMNKEGHLVQFPYKLASR